MVLRKCLLLFCLILFLKAQDQIGLYEQQGQVIPLDLSFTNEYGQTVLLKELIHTTPTIITFNYFDCPSLCSPQLQAVASVLNKLDLKPYIEYKTITISISPHDTVQKALEKKQSLLKSIHKPFPVQTWNFLTSNQTTIDTITHALGFKYEKRIKDGVVDYLHPAAIMVVTPKGRVSRYLNGITYLPFDLKLALLEASEEKSNPTIAKTLLYCFAYDAKSKTYVFQAEKVVGSFMFAIVLIFFIYLIKSGRKRNKDGHNE